MTRRQLTNAQWKFIEPYLPIGRFGPYPERLREQFEGVIWRFRSSGQWREMPSEFGPWATVYRRFRVWRDAGVFTALLQGLIAEAVRVGRTDLSLVSVDSTTARAHHDAAGMHVGKDLMEALEEAAHEQEKARKKGRTAGTERTGRASTCPTQAQAAPEGSPARQVPGRTDQQGPPCRRPQMPSARSEHPVAQIEAHWSGAVCPPVRMLPDRLSADDLPKASETLELGCAIGVEEATLSPVYVNFDTDPLLVIYGESESGKSTLLRLIAQRIADQHQPHEALLLVGDYRRGLFGHLPEDHVLHYAPAVGSLEQGLAQLGPLLGTRMPTEDTTAEQMRARSWWQGPEVFVVIDDYDLVALPSGNPLEAIAEYLPYAGDIGLRVIVARSTAGAARATFEPVTRRLKELGAQGIILSGDPEEGPLIGTTKATPMPPGRAQFVPRRGPTGLVQIGFLPTAS